MVGFVYLSFYEECLSENYINNKEIFYTYSKQFICEDNACEIGCKNLLKLNYKYLIRTVKLFSCLK